MKYVDLFAGCGGLSLGIERAGGVLELAVEKSDMAARTFFHNLIGDARDVNEWKAYVGSSVSAQVARKMLVRELGVLLSDDSEMVKISDREIDLVVGGPPCQGFSLAGRRNRDDVRNVLPWQYLDFVAKVAPKVVVIENVVGMNHRFSDQVDSSFTQLKQALSETGEGYAVQAMQVNALHYGAPQHRPRLMLIGLRRDLSESLGIYPSVTTWVSHFADELSDERLPDLVPVPTVSRAAARTVEVAIADLADSDSTTSTDNRDYVDSLHPRHWPDSGSRRVGTLNNVQRRHRDRTIQRFRLYEYLSLAGLDQRMVSKAARLPAEESEEYLSGALQKAPMPARAPDGTLIAHNVEDLAALVRSLATRKHSQKVLSWNEPAKTVVTLPDDYVHPTEARIFTVRELARFQGFHDGFEFLGAETTGAHRRRIEVPQYSQVGNAVSPWLAFAVGQRIEAVLEKNISR
jgi:DNA (cytosine-5)-methyltransferase 1